MIPKYRLGVNKVDKLEITIDIVDIFIKREKPKNAMNKPKNKSRHPAFLQNVDFFGVAGAEGLEPSARGFGAS